MAIVVISFITILATIVISAAMGNLTLKTMENKTKKTFYTAESALDEIYAGIGMDSMTRLSESYRYVVANLVKEDSGYQYMISNDEANKELKERYIISMLKELTKENSNVDFLGEEYNQYASSDNQNVISGIIEKLNAYIENVDMAYVKTISNIHAYKNTQVGGYRIILSDVVVVYQTQEGYFADVTVDMECLYPNVNIDFTGANNLDAFKEYAIISNKDINIKNETAINVNVNSNIIAGKDINITNGANLKLGNGAWDINVIAEGSLVVQGTSLEKSNAVLSTLANLWCENIIISRNEQGGKDVSSGANFTSGEGSNMYVLDDLELNGKYSNVTLKGNYYGYSYDGYTENIVSPAASSAIIANGQYSLLNIQTTKLILGGHAYIRFDESENSNPEPYMTGEALSVIGNQQMYLVPDEYINDDGTVTIDETFFAYSLLNASKPYIEKKVIGHTNYYLNFRNKISASNYAKAVLSDSFYQSLFGTQSSTMREQRNLIKSTANAKIKNILAGGGITIASGVDAYSIGTMITAADNSATVFVDSKETYNQSDVTYSNGTGIISADGFVLTALNLKNRYKLISKVMCDLNDEKNGKAYIVNDIYEAVKAEKGYILTDQDLLGSAATNTVDFSLISSTGGYSKEFDFGGIKLCAIASDSSYSVPTNVTAGIIIARGDITLDHDFTGLIISEGNINIKGNATIVANISYVDEVLKNTNTDDFNKYFYAYKEIGGEGESIKISNLGYSDLVSFNNWRKYDAAR